MQWDDIKVFCAVAEQGSLRDAAKVLGVNHSTVSRRLQAFQQQQQCELFQLSGGSFSLSDAGSALLPQAQAMQQQASQIERYLAGLNSDFEGSVKPSTGDALLTVLTPALSAFKRLHPKVRVDLAVTSELAQLQRGEADIALRITSTPPEPLVGRRVGAMAVAHYTHKQWQQLYPLCDSPDQLPLIAWSPEVLPAQQGAEAASGNTEINCTVNNTQGMLAALDQGLGQALTLCCLADQHPELIRFTPPWHSEETSLWLLTHPSLRDKPRIQALMNLLVEQLRAQPAILFG